MTVWQTARARRNSCTIPGLASLTQADASSLHARQLPSVSQLPAGCEDTMLLHIAWLEYPDPGRCQQPARRGVLSLMYSLAR